MKRYAVMLFSILFAASLLLCVGSVKVQAVTLKNPSIVTLLDDDDEEYSVTTWDCVYLGHYYQSNNNSKDQIKWRVLSVNGNDAFLLADQCLDCKPYNDTDSGATWSECSLRSWLNSTFYNAAFNSSEKGAIKSSTVINNVGENTKDWIYLLSNEEVETAAYGFPDGHDFDQFRQAKASAYAKSLGARTYVYADDRYYSSYKSMLYAQMKEGNGEWWLRTTGRDMNNYTDSCRIMHVGDDGFVSYGMSTDNINDKQTSVRPCLHIDLSSNAWSPAGTVSSDWSFTCANHTWDKGVETKAATCKEAGTKEFTCSICGMKKTETIPKLTSHTYTKWITPKAATTSATGTKERTCTVCGEKQTEIIPKLTKKEDTKKTTAKATKITAKNKFYKVKKKTKSYTVTLKSGKTPVMGVKITLKVNGKTYTAKTNKKGQATFKIKNLKKKGKYTATITFAGNKSYKKSTKKVKITVKK